MKKRKSLTRFHEGLLEQFGPLFCAAFQKSPAPPPQAVASGNAWAAPAEQTPPHQWLRWISQDKPLKGESAYCEERMVPKILRVSILSSRPQAP